ncbi:MAG: archease [Actinomycetota bacterium]|nr:MAG: archease [Actinomycetota bacterium]
MAGGFELLDHTADVGIRAWGGDAREAFAQAALGLAELMGVRASGPGEVRRLRLEGEDPADLLVGFLNELLYLHETELAGFVRVEVEEVSDRALEAEVELAPLRGPGGGVAVKAATYHQVAVERRPDGAVEVRVYVDV